MKHRKSLLIAALAIAAIWGLGRLAGGYLPGFRDWVADLGAWGPLVFIVGYALATLALIPGSVLTLSAGAIFGLAEGVVYVFVAATLGACGAFLIGRHLARSMVEKRVAANPRFAAVDRAIAQSGGRIVFLLRLSPVFPFTFLNYALGLTRVRFRDYTLACVGMLPGTLLYVYLGKVAAEAATLAGGGASPQGALRTLVWAVGLAATAAVTVYVTAIARRALRSRVGVEAP
ncbi:MAG: TVP38/TMEM64 family protein [Myxococcota bacterium]